VVSRFTKVRRLPQTSIHNFRLYLRSVELRVVLDRGAGSRYKTGGGPDQRTSWKPRATTLVNCGVSRNRWTPCVLS